MKVYDIIYSIGRDCACASYMKRALLRATSGPFDWITGVGFSKRIDIIRDNFRDFLEKDFLKFQEKKPGKPDDKACDYYYNQKTGFHFPHDFPTGIPLDTSLPDVQEKYSRRIARFYQNIRSAERVLIVYQSHFPEQEPGIEEIIDSAEKLCQFFQKKLDFLIVMHDENMKTGSINYELINGHIHLYRLFSWDNIPLQFLGRTKYLDPIFRKFGLPDTRKRRQLKGIGRILTAILPVRSWRKKVRSYFK